MREAQREVRGSGSREPQSGNGVFGSKGFTNVACMGSENQKRLTERTEWKRADVHAKGSDVGEDSARNTPQTAQHDRHVEIRLYLLIRTYDTV